MESRHRLFFACWPDPEVRDGFSDWIGQLRKRAGGRAIPAEKLHMTVCFMGYLSLEDIEAASAAVSKVILNRHRLVFDKLEYVRHNRILWASCSEVSPALTDFVKGLYRQLAGSGFKLDPRPFVPHVTLFRKTTQKPERRFRPVCWEIDGFCLVESRVSPQGSEYEIIRRWYASSDVE